MSGHPMDGLDAQDQARATLLHLSGTRPLTVADLDGLDPRLGRVELIDGNPIVTPNLDLQHRDLCVQLTNRLNAAVPVGLRAYTAITVFDSDTDKLILVPDVAVIDPAQAIRDGLGVFPTALVLAVEVTSSTREADLGLKKEWYSHQGVPYIVVDRVRRPYQYRPFGDLPGWASDLT